MNNPIASCRARSLVPLLLFSAVFAASCSGLRLISTYDEITDKSVTRLEKDIDAFLTKLERSAPAYTESVTFYDKIRVDLRAIQIRASVRSGNEITVDQLRLVAQNIDRLEEAHKEGFQSSSEEIGLFRDAFAVQFRAILKLELAKKRGDKTESR